MAIANLVLSVVARIGLVRACGMSTGLRMRVDDGAITLYGKVSSLVERQRAENALRGVSGVRELWSLVRVVENSRRGAVEKSDAALRVQLAAASRTDRRLAGVHVTSVDDGVVLLTGRARNEEQRERAVEAARACNGVRDVASLIRLTA